VVIFALLDGGSLFSGLGSDIQLIFGLWCSAVSTVPVALVMFPGCIGMLLSSWNFCWMDGVDGI
jgi:hypothetical protein